MRLQEYGPWLVFRGIALGLSVVILGASILVSPSLGDSEKLSAYECGFNPFDDARSRFDIRFYLVAILFIVFDLEASFLFPWGLSLSTQGELGFRTMLDFLVELVIGFVYVWKVGALEWE
jgi:NADH-quinone oxidoreductase subunit A